MSTDAFVNFDHLIKSGVSGPLPPLADLEQGWFNFAFEAQILLGFQRRRMGSQGPAKRHFTFGASGGPRVFALPCADLHRDGHSWIGNVTWAASKGKGHAVMAALQKEIEERFGQHGVEEAMLQCVLTVEGVGDPQEVVWQILRADGETVFEMPLHRDVNRRNPQKPSTEIATFDFLAMSGS